MIILFTAPVLMFGFGFAMVPLYEVFCEITGLRPTDQGRNDALTAETQTAAVSDRSVKIHLDANVDSGLAWDFRPEQNFLTVKVGEMVSASYTAANLTGETIVGHAIFDVVPKEATLYLGKMECFCFTEQPLASGEEKSMPLKFFVSPNLPEHIRELTLSYRFYNKEDATAMAVATRR